MKATLLETRKLDNGTTLSLYDASRRQAADRWIVTLEARLDIPVDEKAIGKENGDLEALQEVLGSRVTYVSRKERVFVSEDDKDRLLEDFRDEFFRTAQPYLAHPAFAGRFLRKQYRDACEKRSWREAMVRQEAGSSGDSSSG